MPSNKHTHEENVLWHNSLPGKHLSASVLCWSSDGALLFVLPTYESWWTLPGGVVEAKESPLLAAARELKEETGLEVSPHKLQFVGINYAHPYKAWNDFVHLFFTAGILTDKQIKAIGKKSEKMHGCQFLYKEQINTFVAPFRAGVMSALYDQPQQSGLYVESKVS